MKLPSLTGQIVEKHSYMYRSRRKVHIKRVKPKLTQTLHILSIHLKKNRKTENLKKMKMFPTCSPQRSAAQVVMYS